MQIFNQRLTNPTPQQQQTLQNQQNNGQFLQLDFDTRQRSRFRATCQNNEVVGVDLPRTGTLKDGDIIANEQGEILQIFSAKQTLTQVTADSEFELMKGAYHLGNRHVPLMITQDNLGENRESALYFEPDYVLAEMLVNMGLTVTEVQAPFEPETGAYHSHGGHSHSHALSLNSKPASLQSNATFTPHF